MTPKFWKYLIASHKGSAVCFVTQTDREWAEKELEGDSGLLSYRANHRFNAQCCAVLLNEYSSSFNGRGYKFEEVR